MDSPLPDALGLFHAKFRLRFGDEVKIGYDGPSVAELYMIDVDVGDRRVAVLEYDPRRDQPFGWNDASHDLSFQGANERVTADLDELLDWIEELLVPAPV